MPRFPAVWKDPIAEARAAETGLRSVPTGIAVDELFPRRRWPARLTAGPHVSSRGLPAASQ